MYSVITEDQQELRQERIAIMSVEGVTSDEIEKELKSRPELYGKMCAEDGNQVELF